MPTVRATLVDAANRLREVSDAPELDASLLACHAWGWSRARLILDANTEADVASLEPLLVRRMAAEPVAYILGEWEFYSIAVAVEAPLLVPRPETEHLVERALAHIGKRPVRVLDLCTGTGCVAIALDRNAAVTDLWATDISPVAVRVASANAARHNVPLNVRQGDLFAPLPPGAFDVIVANPPYVADGLWEGLSADIRNYEDPAALLSGPDGLNCIRRIVAGAPSWLLPGGLLGVEIGEEQGTAVQALFEGAGFQAVGVDADLAGHDRIVHGVWRPLTP